MLRCSPALLVAAAFSLDRDDEPPPAPAPSSAAVVVEQSPQLPLEQPQPSATPEPVADTVVLRFTTNVPVRVLEARDQAMFAHGAIVDHIEAPRSNAPLQLILRAEGYRDREIDIIPTRDQTVIADLEESPPSAPNVAKLKTKAQTPNIESAQSEPVSPEPPPKPTDNSFAPGIVNPWEPG